MNKRIFFFLNWMLLFCSIQFNCFQKPSITEYSIQESLKVNRLMLSGIRDSVIVSQKIISKSKSNYINYRNCSTILKIPKDKELFNLCKCYMALHNGDDNKGCVISFDLELESKVENKFKVDQSIRKDEAICNDVLIENSLEFIEFLKQNKQKILNQAIFSNEFSTHLFIPTIHSLGYSRNSDVFLYEFILESFKSGIFSSQELGVFFNRECASVGWYDSSIIPLDTTGYAYREQFVIGLNNILNGGSYTFK